MRIGQKGLCFGAGAGAMAPDTAGAAEPVTTNILEAAMETMMQAQHSQADFTWLLTCAGLVLLMQIGFLMLEAGTARWKNSINIAQKNLCDLLISIAMFAVFGFSFMFGASQWGLIGWDKQHLIAGFQDEWTYAFFAYQAMFVGTAATIVSGAVSERMKLKAYIAIAVLIGAVIYPIYGHWAWGNLLMLDNRAWLADLGFIDFAGSTVVHATGGMVALIAIWMVGPRRDKYDENGNPQTIQGYSMILATAGAVILFVGWIGFNGGSTPSASEALGHIIINTILAASLGGTVAMWFGKMRDELFQPRRSINGMLGGLVAVTAGADAVAPLGACLIGVSAGFLVVVSEDFIERRLKLDDVVGAVTVHGVAGIYGTLAVALFALETNLAAGSRLDQLGVQALGVGVNIVWVAAIAVPGIWVIDKWIGLRVSEEAEKAGLNMAEHGASLGTYALQESLQAIADGRADLATRLDETTGDDAAELAMILNPFLAKVQGLVGDVSQTSGHLAAELSTVASAISSSAVTIDARTGDVEIASQTVASSTETAAEDVRHLRQKSTELAGTASTVSGDIRQIAAFVENLDKAVSTVAQNADSARSVSDEAVGLSQTASQTVSQLSAAADEIEAVVDLIIGIQNQTNLLALNATIEAARAGHHGEGFSVVAQEIKALSNRTAGATEDIRNAILKVRDTSIGSRDMITEVGSILKSVADAVSEIHATAEQEHGNVSAIVRGVEDAALRVSELSEGVTDMEGQTRSVEQAVHHATAHAQASKKAAEELRNEADQGLEASRSASEASHEMEGIAVGMSFRAGGLLK